MADEAHGEEMVSDDEEDTKAVALSGDSSSDDEEEDCDVDQEKEVYIPGHPIGEDEKLVCDESAYVMYHQAHTGAPCMTFDIIRDKYGEKRETFPLTCFLVSGTQAERSHTNKVIVMRMRNLHKTLKESKDDDDEDGSDDEMDDNEVPELEAATLNHNGCVNRIRTTCINETQISASWSENGKVYIWDLSKPLAAVNDSAASAAFAKSKEEIQPMFVFPGHQVEGYAIDWSPLDQGRLASGDCNKNIHIWTPKEDGTWQIDQRPYSGHTASVEDIQWSPNESTVFSSCSVDKSIRIWDIRAPPSKACMLTATEAHSRDVNVVNWNKNEPFLLSGGDDGEIKVWDLRQFQTGKPVATFKHHTAPITSVEWSSNDSSVFAASGSDDQVTLWDLAVEKDTEAAAGNHAEPDVPPQLLFIHQGQTDIKEIHWHPQLTGVLISTAHSGFNIFRTISV